MSDNSNLYNDFFSSLVSEIKNYSGKDPLLPWLRGIRKMKETIPPQLLKEKLPRFLQRCAETFQADRRYANDLRYLRVWLQLMDFVDEPKTVLRTMETNRIGLKKSLFYQAYALYFEKMKKFEAAEKMYHLGVQNLAEPVDELQKSYEQFLQRIQRHQNKRNLGGKIRNLPVSLGACENYDRGSTENDCSKPTRTWLEEPLCRTNYRNTNAENFKALSQSSGSDVVRQSSFEETKAESSKIIDHYSDDTVVVKFVDTATVGKSDAEDRRHHGLVEPTINTKEAMNAINNMFREPLEPSIASRRSHTNQSKTVKCLNNGLEIFNDETSETKDVSSCQNSREDSSLQVDRSRKHPPLEQQLQIFVDDEENGNVIEMASAKDKLDCDTEQNITEDAKACRGHYKGFVFTHPLDVPLDSSKSISSAKPHQPMVREDTVVYRFVGSTISSEPEVENVCHNGLVEPTINLKEAMDDINSMFGKPIEFIKERRSKRKDEANHSKSCASGFLILPDDELEHEHGKPITKTSSKSENDLFEQTICTREAMSEINKMFGMPLDF